MAMADIGSFSPSESEVINTVLKRDRELRFQEEIRIKRLRQELVFLRRRAALRPGVDPARSCARCLAELGLVLHRGAPCPACGRRVCKECRQHGHREWLCVYCFKQMQLKAISGEWMKDFTRLAVNACVKIHLSEQVGKMLHQSQVKGHSDDDLAVKLNNIDASALDKPADDFPCVSLDSQHTFKEHSAISVADNKKEIISNKFIPYLIPKVSPWNGIDPEPSIPMRIEKSRYFENSHQIEIHGNYFPRDLQSSDEGHYTLGCRSRSTSSEVTEEGDNHFSIPLLKKKLNPLRKQQAVFESNKDLQQSSIDTIDSGVSSPVLKNEGNNLLYSQKVVIISKNHQIDQIPVEEDFANRPRMISEMSSSDTDEEKHDSPDSTLFRKVSLKKKKKTGSKGFNGSSMSVDESGNSLRSSPHDRLRMRNRSLSGGSEDIKHRKGSVPQIAVSECSEGQIGKISSAGSERESLGVHEDEIDQAFAYHSRSQMSLSSFGVRSESVTSVYSAAGGGRYGTVTVTGEILFGLSYVYKAGTFEVLIKECRNLAAVDLKRNRSDPYVKIYLLPDRTKSGKRKTKVKKHTLSPIFDESLKFHITISELEIRTLWLSVWHSDRFGRNDFLGEIMLPLSCDVFENHGMKWYPLQERLESFETPVSYKGDLILALKFVPPDVTCIRSFKKPGSPVKGALEVLVREARNLMATRSNGTSDPFCKSYLLPDKSKSGKQKTPVFKKSCNPKWNHTFIYQDVSIEDLKDRCLELTIWDYDKITSNDFLGGIRLCLGTGKYQGRDVDWMDSLGEERSLWYTMLERPNTWIDGYLLLRPNMQSRRTV